MISYLAAVIMKVLYVVGAATIVAYRGTLNIEKSV